jgi:hypothetical protein
MGSPEPPPAGAEEELQGWLRDSPVLSLERVPSGSNAVFEVRLGTPTGQLPAIYKPARGERSLWDFPPGTLHRREVGAYLVDRALGWHFTPTTVLRQEAPLGPGSVQEFISAPPPELTLDSERLALDLRGLAALDVLINNADRKGAHLLVDPQGELRAIDHGVTFNIDFKLRTVLIELGGSEVPAPWLAALSTLLGDEERMPELRRALRRLLRQSEVQAFEGRAQQLLEAGHYPVLHAWHGRPFEW